MKFVDLRKSFVEKNGKYEVRFDNYSDIGIYSVSCEYHDSEYEEDLKVSVVMSAEEGVVTDLSVNVNVVNVERISKRRERIAFNIKYNYIISYIDKVKERHNNVLDIEFIKDVVDFILNCDNFSNTKRYEVVIEDEEDEAEDTETVENTETVETTDTIDDTETTEKKVLKMKGLKGLRSFDVTVNGLEKSYSCSTEEVETAFGYTDIVYKMEAKSTVLIDGEYALIKAYVELYDGVVTHVHIGRDNNHLQLESFLDSMTAKGVAKKVDMLVDDIKYEVSSYIGEKDINFAYSILTMVLSLNSYDSNTCLYNEETYSLVQLVA